MRPKVKVESFVEYSVELKPYFWTFDFTTDASKLRALGLNEKFLDTNIEFSTSAIAMELEWQWKKDLFRKPLR